MSKSNQKGQAILILLFFVIVSIMVTSSAVIIAFINSQASSKIQVGSEALSVAESGAENALLRLVRNPSYTGETVNINGGTALISVTTTGSTKTILSTGTVNNFIRKIQVVGNYTDNVLTVSSWKEVP